jgi:hypothetical protein
VVIVYNPRRLQIQQSTGLTVAMIPVDLCATETANCSAGCNTIVAADSSPLLVNTNGSSFTGVNVNYIRSCESCDSLSTVPWMSSTCSLTSCLNGGTCRQQWNGYKLVEEVLHLILVKLLLAKQIALAIICDVRDKFRLEEWS